MMGAISEALIRRASARISETAPGRTPIAVARPPLVLPGFSSPRSIILTFSTGTIFLNFRNEINSDYPKYSLTFISEYQKRKRPLRRPSRRKLGSGAKVADMSSAGRADGEGDHATFISGHAA